MNMVMVEGSCTHSHFWFYGFPVLDSGYEMEMMKMMKMIIRTAISSLFLCENFMRGRMHLECQNAARFCSLWQVCAPPRGWIIEEEDGGKGRDRVWKIDDGAIR